MISASIASHDDLGCGRSYSVSVRHRPTCLLQTSRLTSVAPACRGFVLHKLASFQRGKSLARAVVVLEKFCPWQDRVGPRPAALLRDAPTHTWAEAVVQPAAFDESVWVSDASFNGPQDVSGVQEGKWHNTYSLSGCLWAVCVEMLRSLGLSPKWEHKPLACVQLAASRLSHASSTNTCWNTIQMLCTRMPAMKQMR